MGEPIGAPRIIHLMRALLLIFLIALLPLRAWSGDSMAMQANTNPTLAIEIIASTAYPVRASATFLLKSEGSLLPCHESMPATAHPADHSAFNASTTFTNLTAHGDCADCSLCQLCHSVALTPVIKALPLLAMPTQAVHSTQSRFTSVPRAPHTKPPIA